jgi:hypothetical protein
MFFIEIDGAYFGTTFPHVFLMTHSNLVPSSNTTKVYTPRIYGYKIHSSSEYWTGKRKNQSSVSSSSSPDKNGRRNHSLPLSSHPSHHGGTGNRKNHQQHFDRMIRS